MEAQNYMTLEEGKVYLEDNNKIPAGIIKAPPLTCRLKYTDENGTYQAIEVEINPDGTIICPFTGEKLNIFN